MATRLTLVLPLGAAPIAAGIAPGSDRPEHPEREVTVAATHAAVDVDAGLPDPEARTEAATAACYINLSDRNNSRDDVYLCLAARHAALGTAYSASTHASRCPS